MQKQVKPWIFLSTLPARGATEPCILVFVRFNISIHAPREGSDRTGKIYLSVGHISIHAPREGSDPQTISAARCPLWDFYPRSPRGERRRRISLRHLGVQHFYPRSPRGERPRPAPTAWLPSYFYPRSPRGERPGPLTSSVLKCVFLSTLPARGATLPTSFSMFEALAFLSTLPARGATR